MNRRKRRELEAHQKAHVEKRIELLDECLTREVRLRRVVETLVLSFWEAAGRTAPSHEDEPAFFWWYFNLDRTVEELLPNLFSDIRVLENLLDKEYERLDLLLKNPPHSAKRALP